jgi:hypothetical protein
MGIFTLNIGAQSIFEVSTSSVSTLCSTVYTYVITAESGDNIDITLDGEHINETYTVGAVTTGFTDTVSLVYSSEITLKFAIENSGVPGYFEFTTIEIDDTTQVETLNFLESRENDSEKCATTTTKDYTTTSTNYTILDTDYVVEVLANNVTLTMPDATTYGTDHLIIKNSGTGIVTVNTVGGQTIDDVTTLQLTNQYESITLIGDNSNYIIT